MIVCFCLLKNSEVAQILSRLFLAYISFVLHNFDKNRVGPKFLAFYKAIWSPWLQKTIRLPLWKFVHRTLKFLNGLKSKTVNKYRNLITRKRIFELLLQTFWAKKPGKKSADLHPRQGNLLHWNIFTGLNKTSLHFTSQNRVETSWKKFARFFQHAHSRSRFLCTQYVCMYVAVTGSSNPIDMLPSWP
jgi:hypothetical protein